MLLAIIAGLFCCGLSALVPVVIGAALLKPLLRPTIQERRAAEKRRGAIGRK